MNLFLMDQKWTNIKDNMLFMCHSSILVKIRIFHIFIFRNNQLTLASLAAKGVRGWSCLTTINTTGSEELLYFLI